MNRKKKVFDTYARRQNDDDNNKKSCVCRQRYVSLTSLIFIIFFSLHIVFDVFHIYYSINIAVRHYIQMVQNSPFV